MAYVKRGATQEDCLELSARLRWNDIEEILACRPEGSLADSLYESVKVSYKTFAVMEEGIGCIAIFGVRKSPLGGVPWMLTSDLLFGKTCRKFIRHCKSYVEELTKDFPFSYNFVSVSNTKAHTWLSWMGFTVDKTTTFSLNGVSFHYFTYTRINNVSSSSNSPYSRNECAPVRARATSSLSSRGSS